MSAGTGSAPLIVVMVSETTVRERLIADVARRFGSDYELVGEQSGEEALASLAADRSGREVAVVIALHRLSDMTGVQFLGRASALAPAAKRGLLVTYGDLEANNSVIEATTFGLIDQWCWEPWEPAEELLFPFVSALLTAWARGRDVPRFEAVRVVASSGPHARTSFAISCGETAFRTASTHRIPGAAANYWPRPPRMERGFRWRCSSTAAS